MQVSRSGRYSVERMLALDEYTRSTSLFRAVVVCTVTPLPMIAIVIIQESVPLTSPEDGWRANYGVWTRIATLGAAVAFTIVLEMQHRVKGVQICAWDLLLLALCMGATYCTIGIVLAVTWAFPVPFIGLMISSPGAVVFIGLLRVICGRKTWTQILRKPDLIIRLILFLSAQAATAIIYQGYSAAFRAASNTLFELPLLLLLPVIKLIMKNVVARFVDHLEDLIPESVMFTVEPFNTIYTAMCLQITPSILTVTAILALDGLHTTHALYGLHKHTAHLLRPTQYPGGQVPVQPTLLSVAHTACQQLLATNRKSKRYRGQLRLRSCAAHNLSPMQVSLLESLEKVPVFAACDQSTAPSGPNLALIPHTPHAISREPPSAKPDTSVRDRDSTDNRVGACPTKVLGEALGALFTSECLVIAEYLEAMIPVVYGVYLLIMAHLPVARYHGELDGIAAADFGGKLGMVFLYGILELASFVMFAIILQRNCRLNALYHLAFVLETQPAVIQTKLIVWMIALAGLQVPHFGIDYSFEFAWLRNANTVNS
ncbi:hypothetical protein PHYPSEUDO_014266 [Phytophthora pseudosyringae]|uniref:Transmembrane protein n=1 Tax=Phytophthora pseudosyringae TaxID=221518 RepID=A0A8T1WM26_9STRA|nr:hypothetical protein PHYPSEUDO_014266 [Phytophthora pseudosyringae]